MLTRCFSSETELASLGDRLRSRTIPVVYDYLSPRESYLLSLTLSDHLPRFSQQDVYPQPRLPSIRDGFDLPPSHHLVYFPPTMPISRTLPDGTDPLHSPQGQFTRRMWAGGEVHFNNRPSARLRLDGSRAAFVDRIANVSVKKAETPAPLVFVTTEQHIGRSVEGETDDGVRARLSRDGEASIREIRNLVFMKPTLPGERVQSPRTQKPEHQGREAFSHTVLPNAKFLFRYSALTFNSHSIHLDPEYCKGVEGFRGLVFHGPLSMTFFCTLLRLHLVKTSGSREGGFETIKRIKYRMTHPLFSDEPVKFCARQTGDYEWAVWAETPEGNLASTGEIVTERLDAVPRKIFEDVRSLHVP